VIYRPRMVPTNLPDDVRALFDGANYAHVATLMPDGSPHTVPVWTGVEDDRIAFLTAQIGPSSGVPQANEVGHADEPKHLAD
jgi:Pyridoxamine 5'-phosphate oxidase